MLARRRRVYTYARELLLSRFIFFWFQGTKVATHIQCSLLVNPDWKASLTHPQVCSANLDISLPKQVNSWD